MTVMSTAGSKFYIGGPKSQKKTDFVVADFTDQASIWDEVSEIESLGSVGDTSEAVTFTALSPNRTRTLKGPRSAGTMEVVCGIDDADEGQIAMIAAEKSPLDFAFRVVFNDAPAGGTASERLFIGKVMSQAEQYDAANNVMRRTFSVGVNSNLVRIDKEEA